MAPDHAEESPSLRVTDRRRFTETGDERPDAGEGQAAPPRATEPAGPAPAGGPAPAERPEAEHPETEAAPTGVQAIFYILWQSALLALGAQDASGRALPPDLPEAQSAITLLQVLQQKTAGNLTREEDELLRQLLHDAQLRYVEVANALARRK